MTSFTVPNFAALSRVQKRFRHYLRLRSDLMVTVLVLLISCFPQTVVAQNAAAEGANPGLGWTTAALIGVGLPAEYHLLDEPVSLRSGVSDIGLGYSRALGSSVLARASVGLVYVHTRGDIAGEALRAQRLRLRLTPQVGLRLNNLFQLFGGVDISNGKDFSALDIRRSENLRTDLRADLSYELNPQLRLAAAYTHGLSNNSSTRYLFDARDQVRVGVEYTLRPASR